MNNHTDEHFYIFGYGSLLYDVSRIKTNIGLAGIAEAEIAALASLFEKAGRSSSDEATFMKTHDNKDVRPVRVSGIRRGWYAPGAFTGGLNHLGQVFQDPTFFNSAFAVVPTYLGAVMDAGSTCTGLIYQVTPEQFENTVDRETKAGYVLVDLPLGAVTVLDGLPPPSGRIAFFANEPASVDLPCPRKPICQSYVDIWLAGAIKITDKFGLAGKEFQRKSPVNAKCFFSETVKTTYGWRPYWINDRYPVYRPFVHMPEAFRIDQALFENLDKEILRNIRFPSRYDPEHIVVSELKFQDEPAIPAPEETQVFMMDKARSLELQSDVNSPYSMRKLLTPDFAEECQAFTEEAFQTLCQGGQGITCEQWCDNPNISGQGMSQELLEKMYKMFDTNQDNDLERIEVQLLVANVLIMSQSFYSLPDNKDGRVPIESVLEMLIARGYEHGITPTSVPNSLRHLFMPYYYYKSMQPAATACEYEGFVALYLHVVTDPEFEEVTDGINAELKRVLAAS